MLTNAHSATLHNYSVARRKSVQVWASVSGLGASTCELLRRCVLCHQEQHADAAQHLLAQRQIARTPEGVSNRALGPLLLVRVSAISNAWVHMQCALWSGEVGLRDSVKIHVSRAAPGKVAGRHPSPADVHLYHEHSPHAT